MKKILIILLLFFFNFQYVLADNNFKFADIDKIIQETTIGKKTINKINEIEKSNIKKLKGFEKELKNLEDSINVKKNIISKEEYNKEIRALKYKLSDFNDKKNEMVKQFTTTKNNELQLLFKTINPIIQDYMEKNSIEILFNSKNIFMGNKDLDLTEILINEINTIKK